MSRWSDQFENNTIHVTLKQLTIWLNIEASEIDDEHEAERRRLNKVLISIKEALAGLDPEFFPEQQLSQLNSSLRQSPIWNNLQAYSMEPTSSLLREANDYITTVVPNIYQLSSFARQPKAREVVRAVEEAYDEFCSSIAKRNEEFSSRFTDYNRQVENLSVLINSMSETQRALEANIGNFFSSWQAEHTSAQTERAESFSKAQIDRGVKFDDSVREWRTTSDQEIRSISTSHTEKLDIEFARYIDGAEAKFADMKVKHDAILEIHGLVGTDGVAGGYQKSATDEKHSANLWRGIAMGALGVAAIWILVKYFLGFDLTPSGEVNWSEIVTATSLTLVLLGASGYAARQSKLHREIEQQMRWFALEVKAIDPFLSSLPTDQQNDLKNELVKRLFGQNRLSPDEREGVIDPAAFKTMTDVLLGVFKVAGRN